MSVRVAYRARGELVRARAAVGVLAAPAVASVVVRLERLAAPPVDVEPGRLWRVVDAGFAERRKTMRNAVRPAGRWTPGARTTSSRQAASTRAPAPSSSRSATFAAIAEALP